MWVMSIAPTRFGRSTVVYGGQAGGYVNRSGVSERSEPLSSKIGDYWGSCGHPGWNGRTSSKPWSGAFVAWVMAQSGISAAEFPRDGRHGQAAQAGLFDQPEGGFSDGAELFVVLGFHAEILGPFDLLANKYSPNALSTAQKRMLRGRASAL